MGVEYVGDGVESVDGRIRRYGQDVVKAFLIPSYFVFANGRTKNEKMSSPLGR